MPRAQRKQVCGRAFAVQSILLQICHSNRYDLSDLERVALV